MKINGNLLITGGSGSLGKAIVERAERDDWNCNITIYSRSELNQARMRAKHPQLRYVLGDIRDYDRLQAAIAGHDVVIHAAAMKRIPEAEEQPYECYQSNVQGSKNVARACMDAGVVRCVAISTDKACQAVTAYGASKLMMEKIFQAQPNRPTTFSLVRYGNVVASNGSVIPIWREQAKQGHPVKITDIRCTRFWMSLDMAVDLLERALEQPAGTILVPKMGKLNLAVLARLVAPGAPLVEMGFRSCEKLHEDLVHEDEVALDMANHYLIGRGYTGLKYTSDMAPDIAPETFMEWLTEAEEREAHVQH